MKTYDMYHLQFWDGIGIEIQPPLTDVAAKGLVDYLTRVPEGEDPLAKSADVTRQDEVGTAIIVRGADFRKNLDDPERLARRVGAIVNPVGTVSINYHGLLG